MFGFESNYVNAGGIRTHYVEVGEGEPLILIHGGGAGADGQSNFADCLPLFADKGFRAIAVDMVGFGETDKPDPDEFEYNQATRTQHMIDFIEALGLKEVNMIGNSMGGTTSAGVAIDRPDLVKKMVLMGAAVNMTAEDMIENRENLGPVLAYDETEEGMRKIIDYLTYDYMPTDEVVKYRYEKSIRPDAKRAYKALMGWAGKNGLVYSDEQLASIKCPVTVVAGKSDIMIPVKKAYQLLGQIPHAFGLIFPKCGHWVMIEHPKSFVQATSNFFSNP